MGNMYAREEGRKVGRREGLGVRATVWLAVATGMMMLQAGIAVGGQSRELQGERVYVVDAEGARREDARVIAVDPATGRVLGRLGLPRQAFQPSIAVAPDGSRVYVQYTSAAPGEADSYLAIIDAGTRDVVYETRSANRWLSTLPEGQFLEMLATRDGRRLFLLKMWSPSPGYTEYGVQTFDTVSLRMLPGIASLPMCVAGVVQPMTADGRRLAVACASTQDVRLLSLDDSGGHGSAPVLIPMGGTHVSTRTHPVLTFSSPSGGLRQRH